MAKITITNQDNKFLEAHMFTKGLPSDLWTIFTNNISRINKKLVCVNFLPAAHRRQTVGFRCLMSWVDWRWGRVAWTPRKSRPPALESVTTKRSWSKSRRLGSCHRWQLSHPPNWRRAWKSRCRSWEPSYCTSSDTSCPCCRSGWKRNGKTSSNYSSKS